MRLGQSEISRLKHKYTFTRFHRFYEFIIDNNKYVVLICHIFSIIKNNFLFFGMKKKKFDL